MEDKPKKSHETQFLINITLMDEIKNKIIYKKRILKK
jgi:hypothetical protein